MATKTRGTVTRCLLVLAGVAALARGAAGCTDRSAGPTPTSSVAAMWHDFIAQALADPNLSDLQRQILADYRVSPAEYQAARDAFSQCMAGAGWSVEFPDRGGGYSVMAAPGSGNEGKSTVGDVQRCSPQSLSVVEQVYLGMQDNPQGKSPARLIRDCFVKEGVPEGAGLSDDAFAKMVGDPGYHASTPAGILCYWDPTGSLGLTVQDAEAADAGRDRTVTVPPSATP